MAEKDDLSKQGEQFASNMESLSTSFKYTLANVREISKELELGGDSFYSFVAASKKFNDELSKNKDLMEKVVQGEVDADTAVKLREESQKRINDLKGKSQNLQKQLDDQGKGMDQKKKSALEKQITLLNKKASSESKQMNDAVKMAEKGRGKLEKGLQGMGNLFGKMGFKKGAKDMGKMAANARKTKIAGGGMAKQMMNLSGVMGKMAKLNPLMIIFGFLVSMFKMMLKVNAEVTVLQRGLAVSASQAAKVRRHFVNVQKTVGMLGVNYDDIMESSMAFNASLGTAAEFIHDDILGGMTQMRKLMGLSVQSTIGFAKAAMASKKSVIGLRNETIRGSQAAAKEYGVRVDIKAVLEATGKVAGQLRGIYGNNLELMGKAVTKAQLLGFSLKEVQSQSRQLLNFQSSIEAELTAELFLNKKLNLERARLAALTGDYDTYMDEVVKNAGDFYEFSLLNVLQQDKLAGALGTTSDKLADMLLQRADLAEMQQRAIDAGEDEIAGNMEALSLQQKFNEAIKKLKILLVNLMAGIEDWKPPNWMWRWMGLKEHKGKRLVDVVGDLAPSIDQGKDMSIYGPDGRVGGASSENQFGLRIPAAASNQPITHAYNPQTGWSAEEKAALIESTQQSKTITTTKFGTRNTVDHTKFNTSDYSRKI